MNKKAILASALLVTAAAPAVSMAEMSANMGWVSEYIFRGIYQEDSSASAGFDYENGMFSAGTWGADVGDGLEYDLYFGIGGGDEFSWSVGYTGYRYTDDFDDDYDELNLGIAYGIFALDVAVGEWAGFGDSQDYTFTSITVSPEKWPYFKFGSWGSDFDGDYFELGYGFDFMGLDLSIAMTYSDDLPVQNPDDFEGGDYALVFGITKGISIGE
jgi:uncharacterized protein (TIGR02001 family)